MALFSKLLQKIRGGGASSSDWEEFEQALITSDLGAKNAAEIIELAKKSKSDEISSSINGALSAWLKPNVHLLCLEKSTHWLLKNIHHSKNACAIWLNS